MWIFTRRLLPWASAPSSVVLALFIKSWKTSAVSTTVWMVETQLCKLRGTSDIYTNYRSRSFEKRRRRCNSSCFVLVSKLSIQQYVSICMMSFRTNRTHAFGAPSWTKKVDVYKTVFSIYYSTSKYFTIWYLAWYSLAYIALTIDKLIYVVSIWLIVFIGIVSNSIIVSNATMVSNSVIESNLIIILNLTVVCTSIELDFCIERDYVWYRIRPSGVVVALGCYYRVGPWVRIPPWREFEFIYFFQNKKMNCWERLAWVSTIRRESTREAWAEISSR